jgi:TetR/AcrR family acrAB operon transcriptional repressor
MVRRTKAEAQATRTAILDAAEHLFQQRGVSRTSLQDIAGAAGVTRGAVYWHFQDKSDLFNAMMERVQLPLEEADARLEACEGHAPMERLRELLIATLARVAGDEQVHRVFEIATQKVEYVDDMSGVQQRHRQAVQTHLDTIGRCLERAGIDHRMAIGLHALVVGLIHSWMLDPSAFDLAAVGRRAIDAQLAGLTRTVS